MPDASAAPDAVPVGTTPDKNWPDAGLIERLRFLLTGRYDRFGWVHLWQAWYGIGLRDQLVVHVTRL